MHIPFVFAWLNSNRFLFLICIFNGRWLCQLRIFCIIYLLAAIQFFSSKLLLVHCCCCVPSLSLPPSLSLSLLFPFHSVRCEMGEQGARIQCMISNLKVVWYSFVQWLCCPRSTWLFSIKSRTNYAWHVANVTHISTLSNVAVNVHNTYVNNANSKSSNWNWRKTKFNAFPFWPLNNYQFEN